jgi:hypothetical protein
MRQITILTQFQIGWKLVLSDKKLVHSREESFQVYLLVLDGVDRKWMGCAVGMHHLLDKVDFGLACQIPPVAGCNTKQSINKNQSIKKTNQSKKPINQSTILFTWDARDHVICCSRNLPDRKWMDVGGYRGFM